MEATSLDEGVDVITRARSILVVFLVLTATTALVAPASAARPRCFGKLATKVGSAGNDTINGTRRADVIVSKTGDDVINGKGGNDLICAGDQNDLIFGSGGSDKIDAGTGDDETFPGLGNDSIHNGDGFDTLNYSDAPAGMNIDLQTGATLGGSGNDKIQVLGHAPDGTPVTDVEHVIGTAFNDSLSGDNGDDELEGGPGNDLIDGRAGFDFGHFENAPMSLTVDLGQQRASGDGLDRIVNTEGVVGGPFVDDLIGDGANNYLFGNGANDRLSGANGNDFLEGAEGDDRLDGGGNNDSASYMNAPGPVQVNLDLGTSAGAAGNDQLISVERIDGSAAPDSMTGGNNADTFFGHDGADTMSGAGGNDWFNGGPGNDSINGGADSINNTVGVGDLVDYSTAPGPVNASLTSGLGSTTDGSDSFTQVEFVIGSVFSDTLIGSTRSNEGFLGLEGNDTIDGGGGDFDLLDFEFSLGTVIVDLTAGTATGPTEGTDSVSGFEWVIGSVFPDTITGSPNNDQIFGHSGNDTLFGADGNDRINGNDGNDSMEGQVGFDLGNGGTGTDVCRTFEQLQECESQGFRMAPSKSGTPTALPPMPKASWFRLAS